MDSSIAQPISTFSITGSIEEHPKIWTVCTVLWAFSCFLVWKFEVWALDQVSRGERIMYTTPNTKDGESTTTIKRG